jgi:two-component sensor histidine kinase/PAS domain-containing protein
MTLAQLQFELAMAAGSSLVLEDMLRGVARVLLRSLDGAAIAVFEVGDGPEATRVFRLPRNAAFEASCALEALAAPAGRGWFAAEPGPPSAGYLTQPLPGGGSRHLLRLPGFGVLLLDRAGGPLSDELQGALRPVMQRVAHAAQACVADRALRASHARLDALLAHLPAVVFEARLGGRTPQFLYVSPPAGALLGAAPGEILADAERAFGGIMSEDRLALSTAFDEASASGAPIDRVVRWNDPDGAPRWLRITATRRPGGSLWSGHIQDLSAMKRAEDEIVRSLREKETLLKEIHHRVKNNLQTVASLLTLQSASATHEETRALLRESTGRVRSMALIHEHVYGLESLDDIEFGRYLTTLGEFIRRSVDEDARLVVRAPHVLVPVHRAVPLGLLLNELLTNAFKYGRPAQAARAARLAPLEVEVDVSVTADRMEVVVQDRGPGLPAGFDTRRAPSLGLRLVHALAGQLRGAISFENAGGARARLTIPTASAATA